MPFSVELVFLEWVSGVVSKVVFFTVETFKFVRLGLAFPCFKSGQVGFLVSFATPCHVSMVFESVWSSTFLAFSTMSTACKGCVSLLPAVVTLWNTWVHRSAFYYGDVPAEVTRSVDKGLSFCAILEVPNIDLNGSYI